jgi:hypothetical protein
MRTFKMTSFARVVNMALRGIKTNNSAFIFWFKNSHQPVDIFIELGHRRITIRALAPASLSLSCSNMQFTQENDGKSSPATRIWLEEIKGGLKHLH